MKVVRHKVSKTSRVKRKSRIGISGSKSKVKPKVKLWKGGKNKMETIQENISRATIVEGQYAEEIRQEIMRKPSQLSALRNQKASALLRKLRR